MEEKLNYKMAMAEIESIVSKLEDNKLDIDELGEEDEADFPTDCFL